MRRSLSSNKKGQWFLISTVIASVAFLSISFLFKDYFIVDTSATAMAYEDFYFWDIKNGLNEMVSIHGFDQPTCEDLGYRLDEFSYLVGSNMNEIGYYFFANKTVDCPGRVVNFGILLASDRMVIYENVNPDDLIPPSCPSCITDRYICENADDDLPDCTLCNGLNIAFGPGYKEACCTEWNFCCPC